MNDSSQIADRAAKMVASAGKNEVRVSPIRRQTRDLFAMLFGWYGQQFIAKFSNGELDESGRDKGALAAMLMWQSSLKDFPDDVIRLACERFAKESPKHPPNLPQIKELCFAVMPAQAQPVPAPVMARPAPMQVQFERKGDGKDWARQILARERAGDFLSRAQIRYAREALHLPLKGAAL